jgi:hypothetical protein
MLWSNYTNLASACQVNGPFLIYSETHLQLHDSFHHCTLDYSCDELSHINHL